MPGCGSIILAAGGSTRLGEPKQLLRYEGETLLERAVRTALAANHQPVIVVLGAAADECADVLTGQPVQIVRNPNWTAGLASSIHAGIATLAEMEEVDGALILLCDQPQVTPEHLVALAAGGASIVASGYGGTIGPPIYFARRFFGELLTLQGDAGARVLLRQHSDDVVVLPFPEGICDVDTPEDRDRWLSEQSSHIQMSENCDD